MDSFIKMLLIERFKCCFFSLIWYTSSCIYCRIIFGFVCTIFWWIFIGCENRKKLSLRIFHLKQFDLTIVNNMWPFVKIKQNTTISYAKWIDLNDDWTHFNVWLTNICRTICHVAVFSALKTNKIEFTIIHLKIYCIFQAGHFIVG